MISSIICIQVKLENKNESYIAALLIIFSSSWSGEYIVYLPQACQVEAEIRWASIGGSEPHQSSIEELGKWAKPLSHKLTWSWIHIFLQVLSGVYCSYTRRLSKAYLIWCRDSAHLSFLFLPRKKSSSSVLQLFSYMLFYSLYRWMANRLASELLEGLVQDFLYICVCDTMLQIMELKNIFWVSE